MRGIEFVNDLRGNYLTIPYKGGEEDFALRMMMANTADLFLPMELRRLDEQMYLYYNISGMQNMEILYGEKPIDRQTFQSFMWQLHEAIEESRELFLPGDGICLEPVFLFWELGTGRWKFLYIPGRDTGDAEGVRDERERLAEFLVMHMDYEDKELTETVYKFYEEICAGIDFFRGDLPAKLYMQEAEPQKKTEWREGKERSIWELEEQERTQIEKAGTENIEAEETESESESKTEDHDGSRKKQTILCILLCAAAAVTVVSSRIMPEMMLYGGAAWVLFAALLLVTRVKRKKRQTDCEEEAYGAEYAIEAAPEGFFYEAESGEEYGMKSYVAEERTVYMDIRNRQERKLYGSGKHRRQKISLERLPCLVGKDKTLADYVIEDASVSRMHAKFSLEGEAVWMQDLNSTNGTYHNGMRLQPNEKVELETEDEVCFGQAQFVFR